MAEALLKQLAPASEPRWRAQISSAPLSSRKPVGQILLENGALTASNLVRALAIQAHRSGLLGDILLAHNMVSDAALMTALSQQYQTTCIDVANTRPDPRLIDSVGPLNCLKTLCLPWARAGSITVVATARPDRFDANRPMLEAALGPVVMTLISEAGLHSALLASRRSALRLMAETCVTDAESCRNWQSGWARHGMVAAVSALGFAALIAPRAIFAILLALAIGTLVLSSALKIAAVAAKFSRRDTPRVRLKVHTLSRLPIVSVMVPLYRESDTVARLITRLSRLTYPRELLDILLVVEENDALTRDVLSRQNLPRWMRIIQVPDGKIKTKPRALNFAMSFARGTIIGVYDAEDAPEPDQIHRVVRRFQERGPELACVQGVLDFYNPTTNWLARCFTIEYAAWFRLILPGMERLGLAVPLGGTTLFFRREILENLGGWDAHNVTEDADLGIRLARHGYYTELLHTVTFEEANCHIIPWIKQRSRWLKGYAITYAVHMRTPKLLLKQLGMRRFIGVQVLFLGTLVQFLLAPILWSFWLMLLGLGHPLSDVIADQWFTIFAVIFIVSEVISVCVNMMALTARGHRGLRIWAFTLHLYFPLAVLAAYKGMWELVSAPFYWDKTTHGKYAGTQETLAPNPLNAS
jgi:cellulose synthase/poly-beta-1,6-N-acetylglucosamine synthase-like glycosyltransferase